jgi:hypothetical protein
MKRTQHSAVAKHSAHHQRPAYIQTVTRRGMTRDGAITGMHNTVLSRLLRRPIDGDVHEELRCGG